MRLRVGAGTDAGRVRDLNEDAYLLRAPDGLFVVCDGMGGAPAGEVASQMAIDAILRQLNGDARDESHKGPFVPQTFLPHTNRLGEAVRRSNAFIYEQAQKEPDQAGMGTTVVGAWIRQHIASVAHVGDSRAYLWHDDRLEPLTQDHSLSEAHANVLVRVLGREPDVEVDLKEVAVQPGDYVVLCSDGLTRMVPEHVVSEAIFRFRDPQRICDYLIAAANSNGGVDNVTVVVVQVAGSWWARLMNGWKRQTGRGHDAETDAAV
jgi:serine/threonine protein phosphatase PrpC